MLCVNSSNFNNNNNNRLKVDYITMYKSSANPHTDNTFPLVNQITRSPQTQTTPNTHQITVDRGPNDLHRNIKTRKMDDMGYGFGISFHFIQILIFRLYTNVNGCWRLLGIWMMAVVDECNAILGSVMPWELGVSTLLFYYLSQSNRWWWRCLMMMFESICLNVNASDKVGNDEGNVVAIWRTEIN